MWSWPSQLIKANFILPLVTIQHEYLVKSKQWSQMLNSEVRWFINCTRNKPGVHKLSTNCPTFSLQRGYLTHFAKSQLSNKYSANKGRTILEFIIIKCALNCNVKQSCTCLFNIISQYYVLHSVSCAVNKSSDFTV
jgi:hypothetical protein